MYTGCFSAPSAWRVAWRDMFYRRLGFVGVAFVVLVYSIFYSYIQVSCVRVAPNLNPQCGQDAAVMLVSAYT